MKNRILKTAAGIVCFAGILGGVPVIASEGTTVTANCHVAEMGNTVDNFEIKSDVDLSFVTTEDITLEKAYVQPYAQIECEGIKDVSYVDGVLNVDVDDFVIYRSQDFVLSVHDNAGEEILSFGYGDIVFHNPDVEQFGEYATEGELKLPYRLYEPESEEVLPLILYLNGNGQQGSDNLITLLADYAPVSLATEVCQGVQKCYVMVPQAPEGSDWSEEILSEVITAIDNLVDLGKVDSNRIYVIGHSLGGKGTYTAVTKNPGYFAAAVVFAGAYKNIDGVPSSGEVSEDEVASVLAEEQTPIWIIHAADDFIVDVALSQQIVQVLEEAGADVYYTELDAELGMNHGCNTLLASNLNCEDGHDDLYTWIFAQSK